MKSGYKTTEFWLSVAAMVVSMLLASGVVADGSALASGLGLVASALAAAGYSWSRGKAKAADSIATAARDAELAVSDPT